MQKKTVFLVIFLTTISFFITTLSKTMAQNPTPPKAKKVDKILEKHGHKRNDEYYWLNKREDKEVIQYLTDENAYTQSIMKSTETFQETLFQEIKGRIKEQDESVPYFLNGYWYYNKFEKGQEYPLYARKKKSLDNKEEIYLDVNELAKGQSFYQIGDTDVSDNNNILAFSFDQIGRRKYNIVFKDLKTGKILADKIENTTGGITWASDNKTVFYTRQDDVTLRAYQILKHVIGTDAKLDKVVFEEKDEIYNVGVSRTKSKKYIIIGSSTTLANEYRFLDASTPDKDFTLFLPREYKHEYSIDHYQDNFYIITNWEAKNFRLMSTPVDKREKENWQEIIPHSADVFLEDIEIFEKYLVISQKEKGLDQIKVREWKTQNSYFIPMDEPTYTLGVGFNPEFKTNKLRFGYASLTTPSTSYEFDLATKDRKTLKQQTVLGGYNPQDYVAERHFATAQDGTQVPISLVYKKGLKKDGSAPCLLYAYGSYGYSMDASFSSTRISLLDRGFVYAIAHIRGGQEMGRDWYENGKFFHKKNTFTDFIDCAKYLLHEKYTSTEKLFAEGGSAGGLLMGAVANMRGDLFKGVIAAVPFVDVVTTMLDDTIPLTTGEYDEWGNPNDINYYIYMLSYSPYDQVERKSYPNMLVTTGLHDSQVQYWEPAKWVARLRDMKTDKNLLLLKTDMEAGHGGKTGRFKRLYDIAFEFAFMFKILGIEK